MKLVFFFYKCIYWYLVFFSIFSDFFKKIVLHCPSFRVKVVLQKPKNCHHCPASPYFLEKKSCIHHVVIIVDSRCCGNSCHKDLHHRCCRRPRSSLLINRIVSNTSPRMQLKVFKNAFVFFFKCTRKIRNNYKIV